MSVNDPSGKLNFDTRSNNYSVTLWVALNTTNNDQKFIADRYNNSPCSYDIYYRGALNAFKVDVWDGGSGGVSLTSHTGTSPGVWHQIAFVVSNQLCQLFLDGFENTGGGLTLQPNTGTTKNSDGIRLIGSDGILSTTKLNGIENDIRIYNRALSLNEVASLYALESQATLPLPIILTAILGTGPNFNLNLTGIPNQSYILQATTNLIPPIQWQPIITNTTDTNGVLQFTDTNLNSAQKFYRVTTP